jgi:hypothetical protein|uniref:Uncharacterized protein n=1 Tax=viral metagenome TaxID=1070528 RepID=A0A6C0HUY2_9ZZZZ
MDDFVLSNLQESRNEWCSRLVSIFCPLVIEGIKSIFNESWKICSETGEPSKYLMTFQNFLSRIPKWNSVIVEEERRRIVERSGCNYLEDLITCVHIIQLKVLTCIRVGSKQKKIDISIPKLDHFIHKVYIHAARKIYTNIYLFEKNISPLQMQKNSRELEILVQECILTTIRESIPTEEIIRAYMDEAIEIDEEVTIEPLAEPVVEEEEAPVENAEEESTKIPSIDEDAPLIQPKISNINDEPVTTVSFQELDAILGEKNPTEIPKLERLAEKSMENAIQRKLEEDSTLEENIQIHTDNLSMSDLGIMDLNMDHAKPSDDVDISLLGIEDI